MEDTERQSFLSLLLSHHPVEQWHLCYRVRLAGRQWALCARCLGIYPALAVTLLLGQLGGPWPAWAEWAVLMVPPLPALVDWATTAVERKPERPNWFRLVTGLGMGVGIGGAFHVNSYALLSEPVVAQFAYIVLTVFLVRLVGFLRFGIEKRRRVKARLASRPTLEEYIRDNFRPGE
ncbi:MAG TPA: DUF2085 domain-containing protein [Myxococcota bacterium]|nr:DUF2085 domain-containing protein [Myxococcota bacterium]HRY93626.1 DUF2085 domain-containing protein [Myxococcota bacterium]HSA21810.1 DUF2085 domain-containing protein [Myxococcota bacterium]